MYVSWSVLNGKGSDAAPQGNEIWDNSSGDATGYGGVINTRCICLWRLHENYANKKYLRTKRKLWFTKRIITWQSLNF